MTLLLILWLVSLLYFVESSSSFLLVFFLSFFLSGLSCLILSHFLCLFVTSFIRHEESHAETNTRKSKPTKLSSRTFVTSSLITSSRFLWNKRAKERERERETKERSVCSSRDSSFSLQLLCDFLSNFSFFRVLLTFFRLLIFVVIFTFAQHRPCSRDSNHSNNLPHPDWFVHLLGSVSSCLHSNGSLGWTLPLHGNNFSVWQSNVWKDNPSLHGAGKFETWP